MKTLEQHNRERWQAWQWANNPEPRPNGIACPECATELMDSDPMTTLTSDPPRKAVHCPSCGFQSSRLA